MKSYLLMLATDQKSGALDTVVKGFLRILSCVFWMVIWVRNTLYDYGVFKSSKLDVPVISVGNLTMGGVGKTPMVICIARIFKEKGLKPVVLIRGYKGTHLGSDEVQMIRSKVKDIDVLPGANRLKNAKEYLKFNSCDVFILDDGFQHRKIERDLDLVVIDSMNPFGNKSVIPRGVLREPMNSLKRADMFVLTRTDLSSENVGAIENDIKNAGIHKKVVHSIHKPEACYEIFNGRACALDEIKDKKVYGFCGIGNPLGFRNTLLNLGVRLKEFTSFEDHYRYAQADIDHLIDQAEKAECEFLITTSKDAVKIEKLKARQSKTLKIIHLDISIKVTHGSEDFKKRIDSVLLH